MVKKVLFHIFRLVFALVLIIPLVASPGQAQVSVPEQPRRRLPEAGGPMRFPAAPGIQALLAPQSADAIRLPASKVVFERYQIEANNFEIYIANDDGSGLARLTDNPAKDIYPRLNRGGTRITFSSDRSGNFDIYAMNPDGGGLAQLTNNGADDTDAAWSPDGTKLLFQSWRDGQSEIYVMNADGSGQTRLTNDSGYDGEPTWSPDGSKIAWDAYRNGGYRIWVMNANGSGAVQLSQQAYSENPAWSPDGAQIAYDADGNADSWLEVWLMNADGSNQRVIFTPSSPTYPEQDAYVRGWSPDGTWITFTEVYFIYQDNTWYWTGSFMRIVSPGTNPPVATDLMGGDLDWFPHWQTLDTVSPASAMQALPATSPGPFTVSWSGGDSGGAGLWNFDVQVRDGAGGSWTDWLLSTPATSGAYPGIGGHTYYFRCRARDNAYNLEAWPADYDAVTTVETLPPTITFFSLAQYLPAKPFMVYWHGDDYGGSGIKDYFIQYKDVTAAGDWTDWQINTQNTSALFTGTSGHTYAFRGESRDNALNISKWAGGAVGSTSTTLYSYKLEGTIRDITESLLGGVDVSTDPVMIHPAVTGSNGQYEAYVASSGSSLKANWTKTGYGSPPETQFDYPDLGTERQDIFMPPANNLVVNPGLEFAGNPTAPWTGGGPIGPKTIPAHFTGKTSVQIGKELSFSSPNHIDTVNPYTDPREIRSVTDQKGIMHLVWANMSNAVYYSQRTSTSTWSTPVHVNNIIYPNEDYCGDLKIVLAADDSINITWRDCYNNSYYAQRKSDGTWITPEVVTNQAINGSISIAVTPNGQVHAAWVGFVHGQNSEEEIYYSRRDTTASWTTPEKITDSVDWKQNPQIIADGSGAVHLIWLFNGGEYQYLNRNSDGAWSAIEIPVQGINTTHVSQTSMATDDNGIAYVVWQADTYSGYGGLLFSNIMFRWRGNSGTWSTPENISGNLSDPSNPEMVMGSGNQIHVVWQASISGSETEIYTNIRSSAGIWSDPQKISNTAGHSELPKIVVDKQGHSHVLWLDTDGSQKLLYYAKETAFGWMQFANITQLVD